MENKCHWVINYNQLSLILIKYQFCFYLKDRRKISQGLFHSPNEYTRQEWAKFESSEHNQSFSTNNRNSITYYFIFSDRKLTGIWTLERELDIKHCHSDVAHTGVFTNILTSSSYHEMHGNHLCKCCYCDFKCQFPLDRGKATLAAFRGI